MSLTFGGYLGVEVVDVDIFADDDSYIVYRSDSVRVQVIVDADIRVRQGRGLHGIPGDLTAVLDEVDGPTRSARGHTS